MVQEKSPRRARKKRSRDLHPDAERVLEGKLYRVEEVAQILQVGETEVRKLIGNGELIAARIAGAYRMTETAIRAYVEARNEEAAEAASIRRLERDRQRELERRQQRDPTVGWGYAQCVWCGVESVLCTRNVRLSGEVQCDECKRSDERRQERGGLLLITKDVIERRVIIEVHERDAQAEGELGLYDRAERDTRVAKRVKRAEAAQIINFGPERTAAIRTRMIERAQQRPSHWLVFRCALCDRPQAVSRQSLLDGKSYPSCAHDDPYVLALQYWAETSILRVSNVEEIEQRERLGEMTLPDVRLELMFHPDNVTAFAELEARERNVDEEVDPDPDLGEAVWEVCRCAHCGVHRAVARSTSRLIGFATCRLCRRASKPVLPAERAGVIVDYLSARHPETAPFATNCRCGSMQVVITPGDGDASESQKLTWCAKVARPERMKAALAWAKRFDLPTTSTLSIELSVRSVKERPHEEGDDECDLDDLPF